LGPGYSGDSFPADLIAEHRNGFITFGSANASYKYTRTVLRTWAKIVASVPDARFAFIRPEAGVPAFQRHVLALFAAEGVNPDRVIFHAVRGTHMPLYHQIDIALDTFPVTGGTTTIDSLWMGVPVVSLVGDAFFERLSHSILSNIDLGDLCARTVEDYVQTAVALASDLDRRTGLKETLRQDLKDSPLGQTEAWTRNFYNALASAVEGGTK
jgi:predicted O-linked N-acetylglucosamine transferase (SPINDLY family)